MAKKILITKNLSEHSVIKKWSESQPNYSIIAESQLKIEIRKTSLPIVDWVFFSSKNAVIGYFLNGGDTDCKFGVIGQATLSALEQNGVNASFIGKSNDTREIALNFKKVVNDAQVLFPIGNLSKRNMAEFISEEQAHFKVVYNSILNPIEYNTTFDTLVFTSPSNVDSYLLKNSLQPSQSMIAIGKTTAAHLKNINEEFKVSVPNSFAEQDILVSLQATF